VLPETLRHDPLNFHDKVVNVPESSAVDEASMRSSCKQQDGSYHDETSMASFDSAWLGHVDTRDGMD
jgi:hypothetical protein